MPARAASSTTYWMVGLVHHRQHLLRLRLRHREEPRAETGSGNHGLANLHGRPRDVVGVRLICEERQHSLSYPRRAASGCHDDAPRRETRPQSRPPLPNPGGPPTPRRRPRSPSSRARRPPRCGSRRRPRATPPPPRRPTTVRARRPRRVPWRRPSPSARPGDRKDMAEHCRHPRRERQRSPAHGKSDGGGDDAFAEVAGEHDGPGPPPPEAEGVRRARVARAGLGRVEALVPADEERSRKRAEEVGDGEDEGNGHCTNRTLLGILGTRPCGVPAAPEPSMPTYEYRCKDCGEELEVVQSFTDDALTECPACGGNLRKVFGNIGITFKGSGFYKTDSRKSVLVDVEVLEERLGPSDSKSSGDSGRRRATRVRPSPPTRRRRHRFRPTARVECQPANGLTKSAWLTPTSASSAVPASTRSSTTSRSGSSSTAYGDPSDRITIGTIGDHRVAFLPRHGRKHHLPPHRVNYRANVAVMRDLGVRLLVAPVRGRVAAADHPSGRLRRGRPARRPYVGTGRHVLRLVRRRTAPRVAGRPVRRRRPRRVG